MNYCIIDVETLGLVNKLLLEVAAVRIDREFNVLEEMEVRTNIIWPENHISKIEVPVGKYTDKEAATILKNFIGSDCVIGFNLKFEESALKCCFSRFMDVMYEFKRQYPELKYNLETVASFYGVKQVEQHRALGDCLTLLQIIKKSWILS